MRIAYFNASLKRGQDGVTRCVFRTIDAARQRGHVVTAVTSAMADMREDVAHVRVPSVALPLQPNYRIAIPALRAFDRHLDEFQPDIIHVNSPCTLGWSAIQYARRAGIPVVATYHTHFPTYPKYYGMQSMEKVVWSLTRRFYNSVDRTFVPTEPILDELAHNGVERLQYLPNGFDSTLFSSAYRSETWRGRYGAGKHPVVLFVSRLVWEKDLRVLAAAEARLRDAGSQHEMVVVGDGHARAEFETMMPRAHFLGYQEGRALAECYASSDIFVFPSTTETFGLVTLEAMASGLAPVAARSGGAAELIRHGASGLLCRPGDAADLAYSLARLIADVDLRAGLARGAVERAQLYEWNTVLDQLFRSYDELVLPAGVEVCSYAA